MEHYYSGEELLIKPRKPYTITKQRERWTDEEHNRFLEALKLYGRAWQRIEEHIGTKTAVQIRSHAQKFFTKLEKEAVVKGVEKGQSLEIEIPPPRPKRKPSNPYPRKTTTSLPPKDAAAKSLQPPLDLEKEPPPDPERPSGDEKLDNTNKKLDDDNSSQVFSPFQQVTCGSLSCSANKSSVAPIKSCAFKELGPILKEVTTNQDETNESYLTVELPKGSQKLDAAKSSYYDNGTTFRRNSNSKLDEQIQPDNLEAVAAAASHNYPRHVPVHVVDGKQGGMNEIPPHQCFASSTTEAHSVSISSSSSSVYHQSVSVSMPPTTTTFHHPFFSNEQLQSISSTFSSMVLSALVQNPAAHAAATVAAATLYPSNVKPTTPSMTALAAATVAAATAWWAAHGLLPSPTAPFTGNLVSPTPTPPRHLNETQALAADRKGQVSPHPHGSEALLGEGNSSDSERSEDRKQQLNTGMITDDAQPATAAAATEVHETNKTKSRKQVDRSSCGSNTASSSEVETDALGNHENGKEELKEPTDATTTTTTSSSDSNRRGRISSTNLNDSWKEVSQGGRLAFQALFSRERLPQSFSPPNDLNSEGQQKQHETEKDEQHIAENGLQLDLNSKIWGDCTSAAAGNNNNSNSLIWRSEKNGGGKEEGMVTMKMMTMKGVHNNNRTAAFKPYKRCSVEANKESRVVVGSGSSTGGGNNPDEDNNPSKRMRLEGGASA